MQPILSVSIAAYNVEEYLKDTLLPFAEEKFQNKVEVLIIDDESTDRTAAIAREFVMQYPLIFSYIYQPNGGWGSTVNKGIEKADGKWFKLLDGDDLFDGQELEKLLVVLQTCSDQCDMVYTPAVMFDSETGNELEQLGWDSQLQCGKEVFTEDVIQSLLISMHCVVFRTDLARQSIHLPEHCFYTDVEYAVKGMFFSKVCRVEDLPVYKYRTGRNGQSMSMQGVRKHYMDHQRAVIRLLKFCEENGIDKNNLNSHKGKTIYNRVSGMLKMQYVQYWVLGPASRYKQKIIQFDRMVQEGMPGFYTDDVGFITVARMVRFNGYFVMTLGMKLVNCILRIYV